METIRYFIANWNSPHRRPVWQILLLLPLWPLYLAASKFVKWMDGI